MVDRIDHCFLNGRIGKVFHARGFGPIRMFDYGLCDEIAFDKIKGFPGHDMNGAFKNLFGKLIPAGTFLAEPDHIDLSVREKFPRFGVKDHTVFLTTQKLICVKALSYPRWQLSEN